jgi:pentatricopeptide repeat protein
MNVCIKCGQLKLALDVWEDMQRDGIAPNVVSRPRRTMAPLLAQFQQVFLFKI